MRECDEIEESSYCSQFIAWTKCELIAVEKVCCAHGRTSVRNLATARAHKKICVRKNRLNVTFPIFCVRKNRRDVIFPIFCVRKIAFPTFCVRIFLCARAQFFGRISGFRAHFAKFLNRLSLSLSLRLNFLLEFL